MLVRLLVLVVSRGVAADFSDFVTRKDKEATSRLVEPLGSDTDLYSAMKTVGDSFEMLTKLLRSHNASMMADSRRLYERGTPTLLTEVFSTDNLRVFYSWGDTDLHYFNYVYSDVENKWNTFCRIFKNISAFTNT